MKIFKVDYVYHSNDLAKSVINCSDEVHANSMSEATYMVQMYKRKNSVSGIHAVEVGSSNSCYPKVVKHVVF